MIELLLNNTYVDAKILRKKELEKIDIEKFIIVKDLKTDDELILIRIKDILDDKKIKQIEKFLKMFSFDKNIKELIR
jgi:hypothetical protein